jgi:hypothetical protein
LKISLLKIGKNDFDYGAPLCTYVTENKSWRGNMPQWGVYHSNDASKTFSNYKRL